MLFQTMNSDALHRSALLMLGADGAEALAKTYQAFSNAMQAAYNQGHLAGVMDENDRAEGLIDDAFDEGFEQGTKFAQLEAAVDEDDTLQAIDESFDDGYLEGVDDARRIPAFADDRVQAILNDRADEAFEALGALAVENDADERLHDEY
jgi:hypothetical protein